ncbi:MAG: DNA translocase FtsK 4TM domain-containing protein [Desertimonas sp.]
MTTWGPSKKKSARQADRTTGVRRALPRGEADGVIDVPGPGDREEERRLEFIGIGLIVVAVLLALAFYVDLAGPLGRGVEAVFGWAIGLGRFVLPVALGAVGAALIRDGRSSSAPRLTIGWGLVSIGTLGFLHVVAGPSGFAPVDDITGAGGFVGALVAEPLRTLIASGGAIVVLLAVALAGALLITQTSLRTMAQNTSTGVVSVAKPLGRAARQALRDLSSLSGENDDDDRHVLEAGEAVAPPAPAPDDEPAPPLPPPSPYDAAADFTDDPPARRARASTPPPGAIDTTAIDTTARDTGEWTLPPANLLRRSGNQTVNRGEVEARGQVLQESLDQHGVTTTLAGMTVGPTVTRSELELGPGVKVARVTSLQKDIAYAMAATDVRILAPIPGRSAIGVEVPNKTRAPVTLGDLLVSPEAAQATGPLEVGVGKDIAGRSIFLDLATTPHLLIAGATGAGKSSGINCIITSLLMRTTPEDVRLILIDPKQVEMGQYNRLPHLLTQPVTDPKKAANALGWAVKEMERRYDILSEIGFRDIGGYNAAFDRGDLADGGRDELALPSDKTYERMPYIVVVVDELNDLMMVAARDVEESITRIAQKARAVGIHLIVATQRPSVNVITGVIKANIPARMAFTVSSLTDSRVILDQPGAEKLVGRGDMLLLPGNSSVAQRIQGSFVDEEEVRQVVAHWRKQAPEVSYVTGVESGAEAAEDAVTSSANAYSGPAGGDDDDAAILRQAMELVVRSQLGSTSMLQRKLRIGFARAGRLMDELEEKGVVGPSTGSKAREVLMSPEELDGGDAGGGGDLDVDQPLNPEDAAGPIIP